MKIKSERDFWSGIMFIAIGASFAIGATNYSMGTSARPGAGYFPLGLSIIMTILGAILLFESMTIEAPGGDKVGAFAWKPLLVIVAGIVFFAIALDRLGLFITVPILIIISSFAGDEFSWRGVIINAVVLTVGAWAIFVFGLKLTIPTLPRFFQ